MEIEKSRKEIYGMTITFKIDETHRGVSEKVYQLNSFLEPFGIVVTDRWNHRRNHMELQIGIDEQTLCVMYEKSRSH